MFQGIINVIDKTGTKVEVNPVALNNDELDKTTLKFGDNFKGMNIFIDYADTQLDPFNNPYFELKIYTSTDPNT